MDDTPTEPFAVGAPVLLLPVISPFHDGLQIGSKRKSFLSLFQSLRKFLPGFSLDIADHVKKTTYNVTNEDCNKPDAE
jgi:hypothetical protein